MPRTTAKLVEDVLAPGGDYDSVNNPSLQPSIVAASVLVDQVALLAPSRGQAYTTTHLQVIETWLAAHLYCCSDKTYQSKSTGGASASFTGQTGKGFEATLYGQTALRIDFLGILDVIDKRRFAGVVWLGKPPSAQIDYEFRD